MTVLGIDTSAAFCGAALVSDGTLVASAAAATPQAHAEKLLSLIDECLRSAAAAGRRPDAVAVAAGPGSFTGLRIGFSTAKGICFAEGSALVAVPTFSAWATAGAAGGWVPEGGLMLTVMSAGRDDAYAALFSRRGERAAEERPPFLVAASELPAFALGVPGAVVLTDDRMRAASRLPGIAPGRLIAVADEGRNPAVFVASIGEEMARSGLTADLRTAEPSYLKDFSFKITGKGA